VGTLSQSIQAARVGGHIALIGVLTGVAGPVPMAASMRRQQRIQGLIVGSRQHQIEFVRAIEATGIKPIIDRSFPLADIAEAFKLQKSGGHFGKIALEF
jgi:NADPH:quinone reductase-like Zn-dependent oxidoreductase